MNAAILCRTGYPFIVLLVLLVGMCGAVRAEETAAAGLATQSLLAQSPRDDSRQRRSNGSGGEAVVDERAEQLALALVDEHLTELKPLLRFLKNNARDEYAKAINDLANAGRRIASTRRRDEVAAEIQLELLRAQTLVDLNTARLQLNDRPEIRRRLQEALQQRVALRLRQARHQRGTIENRIEQLQSQLERVQTAISQLESNESEHAAQEFQNIMRRVEQARRAAPNPQRKASD